MTIDEIPDNLKAPVSATGRVFDVSGTVEYARAWAKLNDAAQSAGMFGPGVPVMPTLEELEPRWEQYNPGVNLNILPRAGWGLMGFGQLRSIAAACKEVRLNIELIKRTIRGFDWEIAPVKDDHSFQAGELDDFFRKPDGVHDLKGWIELILEDLLVLDAVTVWPRMEGKDMVAAEVISSDTIRINIDFRGRPAFPPAPAYFQVLWGVPRMWTTSDRIIYSMMHPRTYVPYGKSPIEDIVASINVAIRRELQRIGYYTEGNVPHSFVGLPETWTIDQIKTYQEYVDALVSGNESRANRFIFVPHSGANIPVAPFQNTNLDGVQLDEHLMKIACWSYGNSPAEFGITGGQGLGGAGFMAGMESVQYRTGINPIVTFVQDFVTHIIQTWLKRPDARFAVAGTKPAKEQLEQATVDELKIRTGIYTVEFVQDRDGVDQKYRPEPVTEEPVTTTPETNTDDMGNGEEKINETLARAALRGLKVDLNQWQDTAIRFLEKGWTMKPNTSASIPAAIKTEIETGLKSAKNEAEIRAVFDKVFGVIKSGDVAKVFSQSSNLEKVKRVVRSRRDRVAEEWKKSEKRVSDEILPVMQRYKRKIENSLRKADTAPEQPEEERERYKREFLIALLLALGLAVNDLGEVENDTWTNYGFPRIAWSSQEIIRAYQERTGKPLTDIADNAIKGIQKEMDAWYGSGKSVDDLMERIEKYLSPQKALQIGATEVGNIVAELSLAVMVTHKFTEWDWVHHGKDVPCQNPIMIAGVSYRGCLELDGKRFKYGDPMPPDAAHPECHCLPEPVIRR